MVSFRLPPSTAANDIVAVDSVTQVNDEWTKTAKAKAIK